MGGVFPVKWTLHPRSALTNRRTVEQAKGFLRERLDITVGEAFTLLRHHAQTTGTHLTDVAHQLISDPTTRTTILAALHETAHSHHAP